ncbi:hypothetical protein [Microbulbifer sp. SSSA005]|uniref:hypothetical protein n=1 Tax=unclassified Microbulbifer TaxID=2619833 RepID=UPI004039B960
MRKDMQRLIDINFNRLPLSSPNFITGGDASIDASTSKRALIRFLQQLSTITGAASTLNIAEKLTEVVKIVENVENDILHSKS